MWKCVTQKQQQTPVVFVTLMRFYWWLVACRSLNICIIFLLPGPKIEPRFYARESNERQGKPKKSVSELCEIKLITRHGPNVGPPPWGGARVFINSLEFSGLFLTRFPSIRLVQQ